MFGDDENPVVQGMKGAFLTFKLPIPAMYSMNNEQGDVQTKEGPVLAKVDDYIMTGVEGEHWPIDKEKFEKSYDFLDPKKPRNGLAVKKFIQVYAVQPAKQKGTPYSDKPFKVKASWGDLDGKIEDYLVQYDTGGYGIVTYSIFLKSYDLTGGTVEGALAKCETQTQKVYDMDAGPYVALGTCLLG